MMTISTDAPTTPSQTPHAYDVVIVGAGPNGIAAAVFAQRAGLRAVVLDRGRVVDSFRRYPEQMRFSSTREKMTIPGFPFEPPAGATPDPWPGAWPAALNPTRDEAIAYYTSVVEQAGLDVRPWRRVVAVERVGVDETAAHAPPTARAGERPVQGDPPAPARFVVRAEVADNGEGASLRDECYQAHFVVVATGSTDYPARINVPGEDLPHVSHYFHRASDYAGKEVVIVGGTSSALESALACFWVGAQVTVVHRREGLYASPTFKSPPRDTLGALVREGRIRAFVGAQVRVIAYGAVTLDPVPPAQRLVRIPPMNTSQATVDPTGPIGALAPEETIIRLGPPLEHPVRIPADAVLLMTGYRPDRTLLRQAGVDFNPANGEPVWHRETCETNVPGLYVLGAAGNPEGTGNRVGITSGLPQAAKAMAALEAAAERCRH